MENIGNFHDNILDKITDFFNCILGNTLETVTIWKVLSAHSSKYFNVSLNFNDVQKGVFIISLAHHCGLIIDWSKVTVNDIFQTQIFFHSENLLGVKPKIKSLPPLFRED